MSGIYRGLFGEDMPSMTIKDVRRAYRFERILRPLRREPLRTLVPNAVYYWLLDRAQGVKGKGWRPLGM